MMNFTWKRLGIIAGLSLSLIVAGCGSDDESAQSESSISEELDYTITGTEPGAG